MVLKHAANTTVSGRDGGSNDHCPSMLPSRSVRVLSVGTTADAHTLHPL
jgi:hypothetical protein